MFPNDPECGAGAPNQVEKESQPGRFWPCPIFLAAVCSFRTIPKASWDSPDGEARVSCRFLIGSALGDPPSPGPRIGASLLLIGGGGGPVGSLLLLELLSLWKRIGLLCECGKGSVSEGIRRASLLGPPVSLPERGRVSVGGRSTLHPNDKGSWLTPTPS